MQETNDLKEIKKLSRFYLLKDLWYFMKENKKWWLLPIIIMLIIIGVLIIFGQSSPVSPFLYALF